MLFCPLVPLIILFLFLEPNLIFWALSKKSLTADKNIFS